MLHKTTDRVINARKLVKKIYGKKMSHEQAAEIIEALAEMTTTLAGIEDALWDISQSASRVSEDLICDRLSKN